MADSKEDLAKTSKRSSEDIAYRTDPIAGQSIIHQARTWNNCFGHRSTTDRSTTQQYFDVHGDLSDVRLDAAGRLNTVQAVHLQSKKVAMNTSPNSPLIELTGVSKSYALSSGPFYALQHVDLRIDTGQFVAITGKSGSGKTTLLNVLAGIDRPSEGRVMVSGVQIDSMTERQMAPWRGANIGVVFQFFQLLPTLTIAENVMLPMDFCNTYPRSVRRKRALQLLEMVDIAEQADKLPSALSGGQQQRAAIARAIANDPPILIADEPTGNLDSTTAQAIFQLFINLSKAGKTVILVTHERELAGSLDVVFEMSDGKILRTSASEKTLSI